MPLATVERARIARPPCGNEFGEEEQGTSPCGLGCVREGQRRHCSFFVVWDLSRPSRPSGQSRHPSVDTAGCWCRSATCAGDVPQLRQAPVSALGEADAFATRAARNIGCCSRGSNCCRYGGSELFSRDALGVCAVVAGVPLRPASKKKLLSDYDGVGRSTMLQRNTQRRLEHLLQQHNFMTRANRCPKIRSSHNWKRCRGT